MEYISITSTELEGIIARAVCAGIETYNGKKDVSEVSLTQASDSLGVSTRTLYRLIANGDLESIKVGHRTLITTASINRYLGK